jgi:hypothetical protein
MEVLMLRECFISDYLLYEKEDSSYCIKWITSDDVYLNLYWPAPPDRKRYYLIDKIKISEIIDLKYKYGEAFGDFVTYGGYGGKHVGYIRKSTDFQVNSKCKLEIITKDKSHFLTYSTKNIGLMNNYKQMEAKARFDSFITNILYLIKGSPAVIYKSEFNDMVTEHEKWLAKKMRKKISFLI